MKFYCLGHYGGGDYYVTPEEGLRNNLLRHSGPIFSSRHQVDLITIVNLILVNELPKASFVTRSALNALFQAIFQ